MFWLFWSSIFHLSDASPAYGDLQLLQTRVLQTFSDAQAKSKEESECLANSGTGDWTTWDCEGGVDMADPWPAQPYISRAAAPGHCFSNDAATKAAVRGCCAACKGATLPFDLSTREGQTQCLVQYTATRTRGIINEERGSHCGDLTSDKYINAKGSVTPGFCNSTGYTGNNWEKYSSNHVNTRAVDQLCCVDACHWTPEDLKTSVGENKCLNLQSGGGFSFWDCNMKDGLDWVISAAAPRYCNTRTIPWIVRAVQPCCKNDCDLILTGTTASPPATTTKKPDVSTTTTTTIPGGDTNTGGPDCFGATASWGPDFDCNEKTDMFCGNDSPDGLDVSLCCQEHCGTKQEKRSKKNEAEGDRKAKDATRKSDRKESSEKRKEAEAARKKQRKEDEWLSKRGEQEKKNKNAEDERKSKRGFSEAQKKKERKWKKGRDAAKNAAARRETKRKNVRADAAKKVARAEKKKKNNKADEAGKKKRQARKGAREAKKKKN